MSLTDGCWKVDSDHFASEIQDAIERRAMKKGEVCKACGISPTELSRATKGYTSLSVHAYLRICSWLGVHPWEFLVRDEEGK